MHKITGIQSDECSSDDECFEEEALDISYECITDVTDINQEYTRNAEFVFCITDEYGVYFHGQDMFLMKAKEKISGATFGTYKKYDTNDWGDKEQLGPMFAFQSMYDYLQNIRCHLTAVEKFNSQPKECKCVYACNCIAA